MLTKIYIGKFYEVRNDTHENIQMRVGKRIMVEGIYTNALSGHKYVCYVVCDRTGLSTRKTLSEEVFKDIYEESGDQHG